MVVMRLDWHAAEDHLPTTTRWVDRDDRDDNVDHKWCSDLLNDFLKKINRMEKEYQWAMADLYGAS
ncbi:hypothetical protein [Streptomyces dysideae]|uniref:hypothetical protein n=1 Tax=Streptomyces dysideae TaxID=909626 RepID=UPI00131DFA1C|nr:hypothetical protein [Streptomyces dysideae]